jgi:hypothetical protein
MSSHWVKVTPEKMREVAGRIECIQKVLPIRAFRNELSRKILDAAEELKQTIPYLFKTNLFNMELVLCPINKWQ